MRHGQLDLSDPNIMDPLFVKRKAKTAMTMAPWQRIASSSDQVIATLATSAKRHGAAGGRITVATRPYMALRL